MLKRLRALLLALVACVFTVIMAMLSLIGSLFDRSGRWQHVCERNWSRFLLTLIQTKVNVSGLERIDPSKIYVFAANHQSYCDIWCLFACLPVRFKFIAKESLFKVPFLGWHLRLAGHIALDRKNTRKSIKVLINEAAEKVKAGSSVLIFPEGTRSINGEIGRFKRGPMLLAVAAGAPIVPIAISGSRRRLPKGSIVTNPGVIDVVICKPIDTQTYSTKDLNGLADRVREQILKHYVKQ